MRRGIARGGASAGSAARMGSFSRTPWGRASGDELGRVSAHSLRLWNPQARRFAVHALPPPDGHAAWAHAAACVALVLDRDALHALRTGVAQTLGTLAQSMEARRARLRHRWRNVPVAWWQASSARGTAFLIAPDVLLTNHHCVRKHVRGEADMGELRFLFGARWHGRGVCVDGPVYEVAALRGRPPVIAAGNSGWDDFAALRVRPVPGSAPAGAGLHVAPEREPGAWVTALGHPFGLPLCTAGVAPVEATHDARYLLAHLQLFSGSSGAPVLRVSDQHLVGIVQSKAGWDFQHRAGSVDVIELASYDWASGEAARVLPIDGILRALARAARD
jgi:Trypsin-like peptidase domain